MMSNREDRLVRFAFGDVNEQEHAEIEALIARDPEARRTVEQYGAMRTDFTRLREVPEDQMSRERLRDAILARGLRAEPEPVKARWGWMWMPAAACALAFAYIVMPRPSAPSSVEPTLMVRNETPPKIEALPDFAFSTKKQAPAPKTVVVKSVPEEPKPRMRRARPAPQPVEFDKNELVAPSLPKEEEKKSSGLVVDNRAPAVEPEKAPTVDPAATSNNAPIVIVEPSPTTGTNAAQEVESVSNVLVGG